MKLKESGENMEDLGEIERVWNNVITILIRELFKT